MKIITCERSGSWKYVLGAARGTQNKSYNGNEPSDQWKAAIITAPHSPIRCLRYFIQFTCPYYVSVHLVRHKFGVEWFVGSQRNDRQDKYDRRAARQDTEVMVTCEINAEELMFISRRRLCSKADPITREVWASIIEAVSKIDPLLTEKCVPECVFRGFCPEMQCCGYANTYAFNDAIKVYRNGK